MGATKRASIDAEWLSLPVAARRLGQTRQTVLGRIVRGELEAATIGGKTFVTAASIEAVILNSQNTRTASV